LKEFYPMKKIFALVSFLSLLVLAAACTTEPTTNTNANSNANMSMAKTAAPSEADMIAKEKAAWDTLKKKDYDAFGNLLASDYIEVTDTGVFDKAAIMADIKNFNLTDATFSDWKMLAIDNDAVILTYQTTLKATDKGTDVPPGPYRSAAVWANRDGKWLAFYYQQTPVKTMPPAPASSPSPGKMDKPAASPAGTPAQTGPDPVADEKLVWDALKSKNYDAFAAYLATDSVELEPDDFYDKAGSVKSAKMFDFSKFELSDWKAAKIDADAAFVTYVVKSADPKMPLERHSTVWSNRGGKWQALLHVGTPEANPAAKPDAKPSAKPDMKKMPM
jgi:hypothetical protein